MESTSFTCCFIFTYLLPKPILQIMVVRPAGESNSSDIKRQRFGALWALKVTGRARVCLLNNTMLQNGSVSMSFNKLCISGLLICCSGSYKTDCCNSFDSIV
ncbi:hypothetical protein AB3S75_026664 [Citrus x aurantiifolia]